VRGMGVSPMRAAAGNRAGWAPPHAARGRTAGGTATHHAARNAHGRGRERTGLHGFARVRTASHSFARPRTSSHETARIRTDSHGFARVSQGAFFGQSLCGTAVIHFSWVRRAGKAVRLAPRSPHREVCVHEPFRRPCGAGRSWQPIPRVPRRPAAPSAAPPVATFLRPFGPQRPRGTMCGRRRARAHRGHPAPVARASRARVGRAVPGFTLNSGISRVARAWDGHPFYKDTIILKLRARLSRAWDGHPVRACGGHLARAACGRRPARRPPASASVAGFAPASPSGLRRATPCQADLPASPAATPWQAAVPSWLLASDLWPLTSDLRPLPSHLHPFTKRPAAAPAGPDGPRYNVPPYKGRVAGFVRRKVSSGAGPGCATSGRAGRKNFFRIRLNLGGRPVAARAQTRRAAGRSASGRATCGAPQSGPNAACAQASARNPCFRKLQACHRPEGVSVAIAMPCRRVVGAGRIRSRWG